MFLSKKETFLRILTIMMVGSDAVQGEITLGLLSSIRDNSAMTLNDNNTKIECSPFGIKPLEVLIKKEGMNSECAKSIQTFYLSHPHEKAFAKEHLHLHQKYHYDKQSYGCVLYSNGPESYSEQLLNEGLAIIDSKFDVPEWNTKLRRAQVRAKVLKKGIYEGDMATKCIKGESAP